MFATFLETLKYGFVGIIGYSVIMKIVMEYTIIGTWF